MERPDEGTDGSSNDPENSHRSIVRASSPLNDGANVGAVNCVDVGAGLGACEGTNNCADNDANDDANDGVNDDVNDGANDGANIGENISVDGKGSLSILP